MFKTLLLQFIKTKGRNPNNLEMILLRQKAAKEGIDKRKIVSMVDRQPVNPNKPILGGRNIVETDEQMIQRFKNQNKEAVERLKYKKDPPEELAGGGRTGFKDGKSKSLLDIINVQASGTKSGKQDMYSIDEKSAIKLPENYTSDKETINAIIQADIPLTEKINLIGNLQYGKSRDKIEYKDSEIFLDDAKSYKDRNIGLDYNRGGEGFSGYAKYGIDSKKPEYFVQYKKSFAGGGVAGLLGERTGFRGGGAYQGGSGAPGSAKSSSKSSTNQGPAGGASSGGNYGGNTNPNQTYGGGNNNTGGVGGGGPPGTNTGGGQNTTPTLNNLRKKITQKQISKYLQDKEEEDLALGADSKVEAVKEYLKNNPKDEPGFNAGIGNFDLLNPGKADIYGNYFNRNFLTDSDFKIGIKQNIKEAIEGEINPQLEFQRNIGNKNLKGTFDKEGNFNLKFIMPLGDRKERRKAPKNKFDTDRFSSDIPKYNIGNLTGMKPQTTSNNIQLAKVFNTKKDLQGLGAAKEGYFDTLTEGGEALDKFRNSAVNFKKAEQNTANTPQAALNFMQNKPGLFSDVLDNQEFIQSAINQGFLEDESDYANQLPFGEIGGFADGGPARQNFAMGKRAFLKMLAGTGAGIAGLKTGLFGLGKKTAVKEAVKQTAGSGGQVPPYFFNLVNKIKKMGDDAVATQDKAIAKKYKDYTLEEDFAGNIEITKKGIMDEPDTPEVFMSLKVDEVPLKGKKGSTKVQEYEEFTGKRDYKGDLDVEPGVPDEVVQEGTVFEDTLSEFGKADGGRIGYSAGSKVIGKGIMSKINKLFGKGTMTTADKIAQPEKTIQQRIMEFEARNKPDAITIEPRKFIDVPPMPKGFKLSREKLEKNYPELDEDMIDQIMELDKDMQGTVLTMLKNRRKNPDAYDKLLETKGDTLEFQGAFDEVTRKSNNADGGRIGLSTGGLARMLGE